jgi:hypothetical protein
VDDEEVTPVDRPPRVSDPGNGTPDRSWLRKSARWVARSIVPVRPSGEGAMGEPVYRRTREYLDWLKWLVMTTLGLIAVGWVGAQYVGQFQTREEAEETAQDQERDLEGVKTRVELLGDEMEAQRYITVQVQFEVANANDRLDQLVELQRAQTTMERREAERRVDDLQRQIERREHMMRSPARLKAAADAQRRDPLAPPAAL